jgi:hypothetical protein
MDSPSFLRRGVAVARILIGIGALVVGVKYLLDTGFLYGGLYFQLGEIGKPYGFYMPILERMEFRQAELAYALCICAILFGLSYVTGALVTLSSLGAAFLILNFAMATAAGNLPLLALLVLIALIPLAMGFIGAGFCWGVDGWLAERVDEKLLLLPLRLHAPKR